MTIANVALALLVLLAANLAAGFLAARSLGVRVEEVSLGVGKPLRQWTRAGVVYTLGLLPLGGYVRLAGTSGLRLLVLALGALSGRRLGADFERKVALVSLALLIGFTVWVLWSRGR